MNSCVFRALRPPCGHAPDFGRRQFRPAFFINPGWGLGAVFLVGINALRTRRDNPGLWTGIPLFLPAGIWSLRVITVAAGATWRQHIAGLAIALAAQVIIITPIFRREARPTIKRRAGQAIVQRVGSIMLYTIAVVLLVLWLLGLVSSYTLGGFIHILLIIAIVVVLLRIISGRKPL